MIFLHETRFVVCGSLCNCGADLKISNAIADLKKKIAEPSTVQNKFESIHIWVKFSE